MALFQVQPPEKFSFKPEDWSKWIKRFERFRMASGLEKEEEESQVNTLIYSMGSEADDIIQSLGILATDQKKYDVVKKKLEDFFIIKRNVIFERAKFNLRNQQEGETVDVFITDLFNLAEHCNFGVLREELIRDRIVVGIRDKVLSEKLQLEADLTLEKAVNFARQKETVRKQQMFLRGDGKRQVEVDALGVRKYSKPGKTKDKDTKQDKDLKYKDKGRCGRCLGPMHAKKDCPASSSKCHKCGKTGHWKRACRNKNVNEIAGEIFPNELFLGEIVVESIEAEPWKANLIVNDCKFQFKLDSGADVTVVPKSVYDTVSNKRNVKLQPTDKILLGPCNYRLNCLGKFSAKIKSKSNVILEEIYVVKNLNKPLLGKTACASLNLLTKINEVENPKASKEIDYKQQIINQYPKLFEGLGELEGEYEIKLKDSPEPFALNVPRKVPFPLLDKTKKEIERMLKMGVISKVEQPTEWCAPMVVTPKSNGEVRICVDLNKLNKSVLREAYPLPTVEFTLGKLSKSRVFSKLDANSAFWQRKLSESSRLLTTFITPWGRFCFNRLPYGISTGSEQFQKSMNNILKGVEGVECEIDDLLVHGESQAEHDSRLHTVLRKLQDAKLTLNKEKCIFSVPTIKALGQIISSKGVSPDPDKVKAILDIPIPTNVAELRSFMGMVNQFNKFTNHLASKSKPLRDLLCKDSVWYWGHKQNEAFNELKQCLISAPILVLYDPNKETKINADASAYGIGGVVLQKEENEWKPVSYLSRALTDTESRYSQIEKECLAFTWVCERSSDYILGKSFIGETDHKPLVPLLTTHNLDQLPPRIQRFRMRLMRFDLQKMTHVPGKQMYTSDALSRLVRKPENPDGHSVSEEEVNAFVCAVIDSLPVSDKKLKEIINAQEEDEVCMKIKQYCIEGWPDKHMVPDAVKPYWKERGEITVVQSLVLKGTRIVIPSSMRLDVLDKIHQGHLGISKCRERAKQSVWWPGLSTQIQSMVQNCRTCALHLGNKPEPLSPSSFPERPWQTLAIDFFKCENVDYLIVVDYFSRYVEVCAMKKNKTASEVCRALKSIFSRHGIPEKVQSDNGPPFDSGDYLHFANEWGFEVGHSSPKFPQSNGEVERAVQTAKRLLKKEKDKEKAFLAYRSTPLSCGYSPAELLMGRKIRTTVPIFHEQLAPKLPDFERLREHEARSKLKQKDYFNSRHRAMPLPELTPGTEVHISTYPQPGIVKSPTKSPCHY